MVAAADSELAESDSFEAPPHAAIMLASTMVITSHVPIVLEAQRNERRATAGVTASIQLPFERLSGILRRETLGAASGRDEQGEKRRRAGERGYDSHANLHGGRE